MPQLNIRIPQQTKDDINALKAAKVAKSQGKVVVQAVECLKLKYKIKTRKTYAKNRR